MPAKGRRSSAWIGSRSALSSRRACLALSVALCAVVYTWLCAGPALAAASARSSRARKPSPLAHSIPLSVSLHAGSPGAPVPQSFLGLSFEVGSLSQIASYAAEGNLVTLLRSLGIGVLRFGGVTADERVAWAESGSERPAWAAQTLDAADLRQLGELAANSGWRVLLTVGLAHYEPAAAAREAAAAQAALGEGLEAIEIGNEPNSYAAHGFRSEPWSVVQYDEQVTAYRSAIEALAPGIPLAGPDSSGSKAFESYGLGEAIHQLPALLTGHHYPLSCNEQPPPTIERLLSPEIRQLEQASLRRYTKIAELIEIPFRLDEANTVSCGGVAGISNTFASALWAVNYLANAMAMGVAGINLEGNPTNCSGYTPVCATTGEALATGSLVAQPEWYALLLAKELIGERPLRTSISSPQRALAPRAPGGTAAPGQTPSAPNVEVTTFLASDGALHFVAVDDDPPGSRSVALRLNVGAGFHGASILALTAPSPTALSGVRLGGQAVAANGSWSAPATLPRAANRGGVITVKLEPSSAALLTVAPIAG
jgi:hypothetical protein